MKPLVIIQIDPKVPAGTIHGQLLQEGVLFRIVHLYDGGTLPAPNEVTAAIVLGGAMGVFDTDRYPFLLDVKRFVRICLEQDIPFLGICLGGQLLAEALGGDVASSCHGERGIRRVTLSESGRLDPLFQGISRRFVVFQWHDDSFALPAGAVLLATSPECPHQAFRYGRHAYGLQFHPEVDAAIVESWSRGEGGSTCPGTLMVDEFTQAEAACRSVGGTLLANFIRSAGLSARSHDGSGTLMANLPDLCPEGGISA